MKRSSVKEQRFREFIDRSLTPFNKAPQEHIDTVCDRVLQRLREKSENERIEIAGELRFASPGVQWFRPALACVAAALVFVAFLQGPAIRKFVLGGDAPAIVETATLEVGQTVSTSADSGSMFTLADGSRVEMRANSELSLERADDGLRIHLAKGVVIVNAAKQPQGHLYVQTKDVTVSVVGTVFLVNAEEDGSRVAVIEGEVRVQHGATEQKLRPGEQVSTSLKMETLPVKEEISWSRNAEAHVALLQQSAVVLTETREAFDVVSVRPTRFSGTGERGAGGGGKASIRPFWAPCGDHPNSFFLKFDPSRADISDMTVHGLISWAYGLECWGGSTGSDFLIGGPGWTRSDGFDIQALIPAGPPAYTTNRIDIGGGRTASPQVMGPRFRKMLQTLLADRFKLVVRRETRNVPTYVLSVAKGGQKLTPWKEGDAVTVNDVRSLHAQKRSEAEAGLPGMGLHDVVGAKASMAALLTQIEHYVQKPVIDRTGLTGEYSFYVMFDRRGTAEESAPSLAAALEKELGLKLEIIRTPVEVLMIESVERPSEN